MPRILFVAAHRPERSPSQRFRYEQYLGWLEDHGYECEVSPIVSAKDDRFLYQPGNVLRKVGFTLGSWRTRAADARRARDFDIVFVQREAVMTRGARFERAFSEASRLVFDLDDAIWLPNVSAANRRFGWMKDPGKVSRAMGYAQLVIAGNPYLAEYASRFNDAVTIIPTTIDTDLYQPGSRDVDSDRPVCIGWSGSLTTIQHFEVALPVLKKIRERFGDRVTFKVIGDGSYRAPELGIEGVPWRKDSELEDLREIDIGLMPLPDDPWAQGKCGLKALQFMALEIPTLASPVGVNSEIIEDGETGFLPVDEDGWVESIAALVESPDLRRRMGQGGRERVVEAYSVRSQRGRYLEAFDRVLKM